MPFTIVDAVGRRHHRWPYAPLEAQLILRLGVDVTDERQADLLDTNRRQIHRWRHAGMTAAVAERMAVAAGFHPYDLWPAMLNEAIADVERTCAATDCDERFVLRPRGTSRRFCGRRCQRRMAYRRRPAWTDHHRARQRERDAAAREAKRSYRRRHYQLNRQRELAAKREYYAANRDRILADLRASRGRAA